MDILVSRSPCSFSSHVYFHLTQIQNYTIIHFNTSPVSSFPLKNSHLCLLHNKRQKQQIIMFHFQENYKFRLYKILFIQEGAICSVMLKKYNLLALNGRVLPNRNHSYSTERKQLPQQM